VVDWEKWKKLVDDLCSSWNYRIIIIIEKGFFPSKSDMRPKKVIQNQEKIT
jgi:hypothetical protein